MDNNLTNEDLIIRIKNDRKELINELFERNKKGICKVAADFYRKNTVTLKRLGCYDFEDILQIAYIYFMNSIDKYDTNKDVKYITFLMNYIAWMLHEHFFKRKQIKLSLRSEYHKGLIVEDTCDGLEDGDKIENSQSIYNLVPTYIENYDTPLIIEDLLKALSNDRERKIIKDYYFNDLSLQELSEKYGFKNDNSARQSIVRMINKIKKKFKQERSLYESNNFN